MKKNCNNETRASSLWYDAWKAWRTYFNWDIFLIIVKWRKGESPFTIIKNISQLNVLHAFQASYPKLDARVTSLQFFFITSLRLHEINLELFWSNQCESPLSWYIVRCFHELVYRPVGISSGWYTVRLVYRPVVISSGSLVYTVRLVYRPLTEQICEILQWALKCWALKCGLSFAWANGFDQWHPRIRVQFWTLLEKHSTCFACVDYPTAPSEARFFKENW